MSKLKMRCGFQMNSGRLHNAQGVPIEDLKPFIGDPTCDDYVGHDGPHISYAKTCVVEDGICLHTGCYRDLDPRTK